MSMLQIAQVYCRDFDELFRTDENGDFNISEPQLSKIETWFNENKFIISMASMPLDDVSFQDKSATKKTFMHVYSLAYVARMRCAKLL